MLDLRIVLETAGYDYEKFTMLMHTGNFFGDLKDAYTCALPSFVDCNVALFEKSMGFHDVRDINSLSSLLISFSGSLGEWAKNKNISHDDFYKCVDGKNLKASTIMHSLQSDKDKFIAFSSQFKSDMKEFIDAVAKVSGISK